jgi:hypothetical protein
VLDSPPSLPKSMERKDTVHRTARGEARPQALASQSSGCFSSPLFSSADTGLGCGSVICKEKEERWRVSREEME